MLIFDNRKFIQAPFLSEDELESVVIENAESIFGPSSIYFPKLLFKTFEGSGTIPDGFVIDPSTRQWYVIEVELAKHRVWSHIAPQVAKQVIAASQPISKQLLTELAVEKLRENPTLVEKFTELGIEIINIRAVLAQILDQRPVIGMPIDAVSRDLEEWATSLKNEVKLWVVRKYVEFAEPSNIIYEVPEEYRPTLDTFDGDDPKVKARYDVELNDLINAGLLTVGELLYMSYNPKGARKRKSYVGTVIENGCIDVLGKAFGSPSYAALYALQEAGSERKSSNGWMVWRNSQNQTLAELREEFLVRQMRQSEQGGMEKPETGISSG